MFIFNYEKMALCFKRIHQQWAVSGTLKFNNEKVRSSMLKVPTATLGRQCNI